MKKSIFIAAMATILPFCGYAATKTVSVGTFNAIKVNSYVNVAFTQGKSNKKATIEGKSNEIVADVTVEVKNGTLTIDTKNKKWKSNGKNNPRPTVTVASPEINAITINGSGDMRILGKSDSADIKLSRSGDLDAGNLVCGTVSAKVTGSGDLTCHASESVSTDITGSGEITVKGGPKHVQSTGKKPNMQ